MSKKKKPKYDPLKALSPISFDPKNEEEVRQLYKMACKGSEKHWGNIKKIGITELSSSQRSEFIHSANKGMRDAQSEIISILKNRNVSSSEEQLLRGIMDSIAWQLLGNELYEARLLHKGENQPSLKYSNFDSVVHTVEELIKVSPDSISLISDLTTFIQVGDILSICPINGKTIHEVKEGKVNEKIHKALEFYSESKCDRYLQLFTQNESPKVQRQLTRVVRQMGRMSYFSNVVKNGEGVNPDTDMKIRVAEAQAPLNLWFTELVDALGESEKNGWAMKKIENCLFLGCYSDEYLFNFGHIAFNEWFKDSGGTIDCPRARLIDSIITPLALPIFNLDLPEKFMFDILFGRKQVCLGLNIAALMDECKKVGLSVRFASKKEKGKSENDGQPPYTYEGKAIIIGNGEVEMMLFDGIFLRTIFHGQKPVSLIKQFLADIATANKESTKA
jgi:hypothetical protein